jgi:YHS domain-containing protein
MTARVPRTLGHASFPALARLALPLQIRFLEVGMTFGEQQANDPICGREVDTGAATSTEYKKRRYYFCSPGCKERFERHAEKLRLQELARMGALFARAKVRWGVA